MRAPLFALLILLILTPLTRADLMIAPDGKPSTSDLSLVNAKIVVDANAAPVVHEAADLLAADIGKVTGHSSTVSKEPTGHAAILIGTLGDDGVVDQLATAGKINVTGVKGQWEAFAWQLVDHPTPFCERALVIVGSDRRGTSYGCTEISKAIGVSPWNWWADVPAAHHDELAAVGDRHLEASPGVKFRGIFLNDEDWGLRPWASKTFDPQLGNLGPKTYNKLFELMLRLRLNYLWPAMHPGSAEFGSVPGNAEAADHWAIIMGASHCEPILRNNVYWDKKNGPWRYDTNRDNILKYWTESVDARGQFEADWTMGIRGIHDTAMQGPKDKGERIKMVEGIFVDQQKLIDEKVTKQYGTPAECFVPYKEVLPLYEAGMKVPDQATLIWPDDNFGYIRHLPSAAERQRSGGSGIYYHVSYLGGPHSYLWVESTSPGLMWEELHKAWQNDAGKLWILNVGDLKPAEIAIDFYSQLAWSPDRWVPDAQDVYLRSFLAQTFGKAAAQPLLDLLATYYKVAAERKPEFFSALGKTSEPMDEASEARLNDFSQQYDQLLATEHSAAATVPSELRDSYFEMIGIGARALGFTGNLYVHLTHADRGENASAERQAATEDMHQIDADWHRYNEEVAGGKWLNMMSDTPSTLNWPTEVGGKYKRHPRPFSTTAPVEPKNTMIDAATFLSSSSTDKHAWQPVAGLGWSGHAVTVLPATDFGSDHPTLVCPITLADASDTSAIHLCFLPTMRVIPADGQLRVAVSIDDATPTSIDIPGGTSSDENSGPRRDGVIINRVTADLPAGALLAGDHTLKITALDPGVVLDRIEFPAGTTAKPT